MALYKEDIVAIELESGSIHRSFLNHSIGLGDLKANRFGVRIFRNGEAVNIGSGTCQGFFMSPNGTNLQIQGSTYTGVDGNMAWVQLPQDAYAYEGQFCLAIKLIGGGVTGTMRIIDGMVANTGTTGAVSPTSTVPTSQEIIAAYNNAVNVIDSSVRFDITQSLTDTQKATARTNIDAASVGTANELAMDIGALAEGSANNSYIDLGNKWMPFRRGYYSTPAVGSASSYQSNSQYFYALVMCQPGDILHAHCYGNSTVYAWAFLDSNLNVLSRGGTGNFEGTQTAPASTSYVLVNVDISHMSTGFYAWVGEERTGEKISDLKSALESQNDIIVNFINENSLNLYNSLKAIPGYRIPVSTHEITPKSSAYISEYIPVQPNTEYTVGICMGSNSYYTIAYYDSNKEFISGEAPGNTDPHNYTTPANAAYAILSGAIGKIEDQYFCLSSYTLSSTYSNPKMVFTNDARLISTGRLVNNTSAITNAAGKVIFLMTPDGMLRSYGTSIPVTGTGNYIYWNKDTNTFARKAVSYVADKNEYLVAEFNTESFGERDITSVLSTKPFIEIDQLGGKINITLTATAYAYCCNTGVVSIPATTVSLDIPSGNHFILVYNLVDSEFKTITSYSSIQPSINLAIAVIYNMNIIANTPVITLIGNNANALKTCVCYGDSLTYYDGQHYKWGSTTYDEICVGFESYMRTYLFMDVTNRGHSGYTTPEFCAKIRENSDFASFDYITIMGGDNDDRVNHNPSEPDVSVGILMPVGSTFDTTTVYGALQSSIEHVLGINPSIRIILMTEPIGWTYYDDEMNRVNEDIPNAYRRVAELYGLPLIDLWNESGVNELTRTTLYHDPAPYNEGGTNRLYMYHPNNDGWKRISKIICNRILEL